MDPTLSTYQRIYIQMKRGDPGKVRMVFSRLKPTGGALVALLSRGSILFDGMDIPLVTDPTQDPALRGPAGKDGVDGQPGKDGAAGADGASAYQIARAKGYGGTATAWLASLVGPAGKDGPNGSNGADGLSAYQVARAAGYGGTQTQWLTTLVGAPGKDGNNGANGADGVSPVLSIGTVTTLAAGSAATATLTGTAASPKLNIGVPRGDKGDTGLSGATLLGTVTLSETAQLISINAGTRRVTITTPTAWGVTPGQNLLLFPVAVPNASYATHDVIATAANTLSIGLTTPAIALLASYSISARLVRIN